MTGLFSRIPLWLMSISSLCTADTMAVENHNEWLGAPKSPMTSQASASATP